MTVRTLHHYDEVGLLGPARRSASGHRLYGEEEIRRLQRIVSLRHLGLALDEIKRCLAGDDLPLEHVLDLQIDRLEEWILSHRRLRDLIRHLKDRLGSPQGASVDEVIRVIEMTMTFDRYYTPQQLRDLARRRESVGEDSMRAAQQAWTEILAAFAEAMNRGDDPGSPETRELARRSRTLIETFTSGDPRMERSLTAMYRGEGSERILAGLGMNVPSGLWTYMRRAAEAVGPDD